MQWPLIYITAKQQFSEKIPTRLGTYHESQGPGCCRIDSTRDWGVDEDSTHHCTLIRQLLADCRIYCAAVYQQGAGLVGAEDTI